MALILRGHGGLCCGIKHIHNFPNSLTKIEPEIVDKPPQKEGVSYQYNILRNKYGEKLADSIPAETVVARLDRFIEYIAKQFPHGITEVVLTIGQAAIWEDVILERGFKMVSECKNSNSHNRIRVYHLCRDDTPPVKATTPQVPLR